MAELKTKAGDESFAAWLERQPEAKREDLRTLAATMEAATGEGPVVWGGKMVGFGRYRYAYASGRTGEWFVVGFAPRSDGLTLYLVSGFVGQEDLLARLGRHRTGECCLYVRRLSDLDGEALGELVARAVAAKEPERVRG